MPQATPPAALLGPRLQAVLQSLAENLTELNALLATPSENPAHQPTTEAIDLVAGASFQISAGSSEPTVEEIFTQMVPDATRISYLRVPWRLLERGAEASSWVSWLSDTWPRESLHSLPERLAAGLGELRVDSQAAPMFIWDNKLTRTLVKNVGNDILYLHWLLGLAYLKPAADGYPSGQPLSARRVSAVGAHSGIRAGGIPMMELCNFETEQAAHGKIWLLTPFEALHKGPDGGYEFSNATASQQERDTVTGWRKYNRRMSLDSFSVAFVSSLLANYFKPRDGLPDWLSHHRRNGAYDEFIMNFMAHSTSRPAASACICLPRRERQIPVDETIGSVPRSEPPVLMLEIHLRHFMSILPTLAADTGLALKRERVRIRAPWGDKILIETVSSFSLVLPLTHDAPYTILGLLDTSYPFFGMGTRELLSAFPTKQTWTLHGIVPCGRAAGVAQFLSVVLSGFKIWEAGWSDALDVIDSTVSVQLENSLNEEKWSALMFDDSFERSGVYFTVLETLRVSSDWARDTLKTWEALLEQWKHDAQPEKLFSPADLVALEENWAVVDRHIRARFEELMTRLTNKTEEIKSLRDGVFNATSLREASKGIELNRAVYIFTVVTVLYTPLGFLATFFALPSLNNPGDNGLVGVPKGFKTTMIVIPLLTYLVSLAFVWYFRHIRRVKRAIRELAVMTVWTWETLKNHFSPTMDGRRQLSGFNG